MTASLTNRSEQRFRLMLQVFLTLLALQLIWHAAHTAGYI